MSKYAEYTSKLHGESTVFDTGKNTVGKTKGWVAPDGADPFTHYVEGYFADGSSFEVPLITHVTANLWYGGYVENLDLGDRFDLIVSLYPWERYPTKGDRLEFSMHDTSSEQVDAPMVYEATQAVLAALGGDKKVFVHCQAGLNRSSLIVANVLIEQGMTPAEAIKFLRTIRHPLVLFNKMFESWLLLPKLQNRSYEWPNLGAAWIIEGIDPNAKEPK